MVIAQVDQKRLPICQSPLIDLLNPVLLVKEITRGPQQLYRSIPMLFASNSDHTAVVLYLKNMLNNSLVNICYVNI